MSDGSLRFSDVGVRYPGRREPSLSGIDLLVEAGQRVGVTGRTGAGKSTLALAGGAFIPRVVRATLTGDVAIDGIPSSTPDAGAVLGTVGMVFATPANQLSASKQSVREELAFGLENLGVPREAMDPRIDAVLDRLGIAHLAEREPFALSGGEQQRVAIASIVAMGTRILILDEPTAQLDPAGTAEVGALLAELAQDGTAILCVEHDPAILGRMDRVALLDEGRMVGIDLPGIALGSRLAGSVGMPSPSMVRLAEAAGIDPLSAFDVDAVAQGLQARLTETPPTLTAAPAAVVVGSPTWSPVRERSAVEIDIEGLVHRYPGGIEAVRDVSLHFEPGEAVAILGQNGSGKTTLIKHLNGLLRPAEGGVRLDGRSISTGRVDQLAATVGFVFQNPDDQLFERSVEREVSFGPRNLGFEDELIGRLTTTAIDSVGLGPDGASNPYDLDLSRRKLVALASVLAMDPAVLVLDEPTTGQDPEGVARVKAVVRAWRHAGRTVIAVTHDMEFAATAFDRVVVMRLGEVVADGPPAEVLTVSNAQILTSTGLNPPPAAQVSAAIGLRSSPLDVDSLIAELLVSRDRS
jgi:energy-coupling factor transport system ATP-binding protein